MYVFDYRLLAGSVDEDGFGHPSNHVVKRTQGSEPGGLIVPIARRLRFVGQQWKREFVLFVPSLGLLDRFGENRYDICSAGLEIVVSRGDCLHLFSTLRAVVVPLKQEDNCIPFGI